MLEGSQRAPWSVSRLDFGASRPARVHRKSHGPWVLLDRQVVAPVFPRGVAVGVEVQHTPTTDADLVLDLSVRDGLVAGRTGAPASLANPLARLGGQRKESGRYLGPDHRRDVSHASAAAPRKRRAGLA